MKYSEYVETTLEKINAQVAEASDVNTVDEYEKKEKQLLLNKQQELLKAKESVLANRKARADYKIAEKEAQESATMRETAKEKYDAFMVYLEDADKKTKNDQTVWRHEGNVIRIDSKGWPEEDQSKFKILRNNYAQAALVAKKKEIVRVNALQRYNKKNERYQTVKKTVEANLKSDSDLLKACIPCNLKKRNEKIARIRAVFPGKQNYGNCGVQSCSQAINLIKGIKKEEAELLKDALRNKEAVLVKKKESKQKEDSLISLITDIPSDELRKELDVPNTGTLTGENGKVLLDRYGVKSTLITYSREKLAAAIIADKVVIPSVDASMLKGIDLDGKEVKDWVGTTPGSHAVLIADGKFDRDGNNLTHVLISDTGSGKQFYMEIDDFDAAVKAHKPLNGGRNDRMHVTENPMNPNIEDEIALWGQVNDFN